MIKKLIIALIVVFTLCSPIYAAQISAPMVPQSAQQFMPEEPQTFSEGIVWILQEAVKKIHPAFAESLRLCVSVIAVMILISLIKNFPGNYPHIINLVTVIGVSIILLKPSKNLIHLGMQTVTELYEYAKLFLPVMTTALAAQGGVSGATVLYAGTTFFNTFLCSIISSLILPMLYFFICLCIADAAIGEESLSKLKDFVKWSMTWVLKIVLYVFTGYIGITGVVSGTTDAASMKAAKLTISGVVPVVGNILSDASEAVLVSAGVMKQAAGVYGLLAMIAIWIGPFVTIGVQYLILKITASICDVFGNKQSVKIIHDFSGALGYLVAMTGAMCLMLLISTVCFMKGMN